MATELQDHESIKAVMDALIDAACTVPFAVGRISLGIQDDTLDLDDIEALRAANFIIARFIDIMERAAVLREAAKETQQ